MNGILRSHSRIGWFVAFVVVILQCVLILHSPLNIKSIICRGPNCSSSTKSAPDSITSARKLTTVAATGASFFNLSDEQQPKSFPDVINAIYDYIEHPTARCERKIRIGGKVGYKKIFDGQKWACLDHQYGLTTDENCLIYSFGISDDWSFDDNAQLLNCEIHSFDPSIGRNDHNRTSRIHFRNLGISGENEEKVVKGRKWSLRTYADIVAMLGHRNRTVHYLKIDVEGSEWSFFSDVLQNSQKDLRNVRQIGMEIHMAFFKGGIGNIDTWTRYLRIFVDLERAGFRLFHSEFNPYEKPAKMFTFTSRKVSRVYEVVWLNQS